MGNDIARAAQIALTLVDVATRALTAHSKVISIVEKANAEGRTELSPDEWAVLLEADDAARGRLATLLGKV